MLNSLKTSVYFKVKIINFDYILKIYWINWFMHFSTYTTSTTRCNLYNSEILKLFVPMTFPRFDTEKTEILRSSIQVNLTQFSRRKPLDSKKGMTTDQTHMWTYLLLEMSDLIVFLSNLSIFLIFSVHCVNLVKGHILCSHGRLGFPVISVQGWVEMPQ